MRPLDIIIPHLNYEDFTIGVKSLIRNTPEGVINKIIFIDQCEKPHYWKPDHEPIPVDFYIRTPNLGFAKAMNTGIRLSDAPYVMCLNDDVVFLNKRWWQGIADTFAKYSNALCVNPASICDPDGKGGTAVMEGFEYKEDYTDEEYDRAFKAKGDYVIDAICMWGPVFRRDLLDKVGGIIPGKAWFDERFFPGGGEDYDLNRRAYMSKMRCLGTNASIVWHHWFKTKKADTGEPGVKYDNGMFDEKWRGEDGERADLFGNKGKREMIQNNLRD